MAIKIEFLAGIFPFLKGTKDMGKALDEVSDSLDDVARDAARAADRAGDDLGDEIKDGAKDAEKGVDRLERSFKEMADHARRESKDAGDSMRKGVKEGADKSGAAVREFGDEARQNLSETVSSFRGEAEDIVQVVQDTFGGVIGGLGPAGMVMGVALAAGIGVAVQKGQDLAEAINDAKERAAELASDILAADGDLSQIQWGDRVKEWGLSIADSREWFEVWQEDAKTAFEVAQEGAEKTGIAVKDMALAMSGADTERATRVLEDLADQIKELERERTHASGNDAMMASIDVEIQSRQKLIDEIEKQSGVTSDGIELSKLAAEVTAELAAADEAAAAATQARSDAANALQSELDEGVQSWQTYYDAESGVFDASAFIAGMATRREAITNFNGNVQSLAQEFGLSMDETQAILDLGLDFAVPLQQIKDSGFSGSFVEEVRAAVGGGQEIIDGTPLGATVSVAADTQTAQAQLDATSEDRGTTIEADTETEAAAKELQAFVDKKRTATITAEVDLANAQQRLTEFVNERRVAVVTVEPRDREGRPVP